LRPEQALAATGLRPADLADGDLLIEAGQELQVMRNLAGALGNVPGLGVDAGRRLNLGSFGVWGYALLTSRTWMDAISVAIRWARLSYAFVVPELETGTGVPRLLVHDDQIPEDIHEIVLERDLSASIVVLAALGGPDAQMRLDTRLSPDRAALVATVRPTVAVRGGQASNFFSADPAFWHQTLPQADQDALRDCEATLSALLERRSARRGVGARVRARLLQRPDLTPTMDDVAADLHVETRTLRRHLAAEGTSFQELRDEVKQMLAIELLSADVLSVDQIAHRLGYGDGASFTHAFKRWTNLSPGAWRDSQVRKPGGSPGP
jgi:AraC-like DNA-binding protein